MLQACETNRLAPSTKRLLARLDTIRSIHPLITALYTVRMEPSQLPEDHFVEGDSPRRGLAFPRHRPPR